MSKIIDERVVSMQFDNKHFENNVSTTMSTLDKLKQKLNLGGVTKGLESLSASANKVDLSNVGSGVDAINAKFSALQVMGMTVMSNLTTSALNAGKRIASALTIDPIKMGFNEYETKINSIQTIMSNTASKGTTMDDVTKVIDELNTYADKTIYNFAEMTRNIGTFTAAGVGLEESAKAIQGIANLAAASGSNSQQASTAMYQLSQALATGTVKLMDWNSVVNAGMGGEKFQEALKATAREHGVAVDGIIKKNGSFRDSLQEGWLSADILNETLSKFTVEGASKYAKSMMESGKWTKAQADALMKEAQAMEDAATKVKTFTQLWDTLKEAAQSGWGKTWEIIIGDFDEAKDLFTDISNVLGGLIGKSADTRNKMLEGWKDLGGRKALMDSFRNMFEGISSVIKPISEAFRDIFPHTTAKQLYGMTKALQSFTEKLKLSSKNAENLKNTFKGIFAVIDIFLEIVGTAAKSVVSLISHFTGIQNGVLGLTGALGNGLSGFRDYIKETNIFGKTADKATNFVGGMIDKLKELGSSIVNAFKESAGFENISKILSSIFDGFSELNFEKILGVVNQGLFAGILLGIQRFTKGLTNPFEGVSGVLENVTGILDDVRGCFEAYQSQLKAGTLLKIASAIGILAASLLVISTIDPEALGRALMGLTVLFAQLLGSLTLFTKMTANFVGVTKAIGLMIGMSVAVSILAGALKKMSSVSIVDTVKGLAAIGVLMAEIALFLNFAKLDTKIASSAVGMVVLSSAILILGKAIKNIGGMNLPEIGKGLLAIGVLLAELAIFSRVAGKSENVLSTGVAMVLLGSAIKILTSSLQTLGGMSLKEIGKSLLVLGGSLAALALGLKFMPKNIVGVGAGLVIIASAMNILSTSLSKFGGMSWSEIGKGLTVLGGSLALLAVGLNLMNGTLMGSASLTIAAGALSIMASVMKKLSGLSWSDVAKGLITLSGAFAVIGIAGALLSPLIPSLLGLSGALALLGIAALGIGGGLVLVGIGLSAIATGLLALASAGAIGASTIVASLKTIILGVIDMIPSMIESFGAGLVLFFKTISESATIIAESLLIVVSEVLASLAKYTPKIVDSLMKFLIGILDGVSKNLPKLIQSAVKLIGSFFEGVIAAIGGIDPTSLIKGIVAIGLLTGLMAGLSAISGMIPGAMIGVLGMGIVIAELAVVLAAVGALAQIPGLKWLIEEGGDFLQTLGTAIGQFIGGIAGGFMSGLSNSFPKIGSDLSKFMTNLKPFIEGAKSIDENMSKGIKELVKAIILITAADVINGVTSWLTGGNSMGEFAKQLVPFGKGLKEYSKSIAGIDSKSVKNSATAAKALIELAKKLPKEGGLKSLFTGDNNLGDFAKQLVPFGESMKEYSESINGMDSKAVTNSITAAKSLVELVKKLPKTGGLKSLFTGDNDISSFGSKLVPFGKSMKEYSESITGMDSKAVENSAIAAKALVELANNLPKTGGLSSLFSGSQDLMSFGYKLIPFGEGLKAYADSISGIDSKAVTNSATAAKSLVEIANNLPNSGGLVSIFTGDNNISTFGYKLVPFGKGLKAYADSISGIDSNAIKNSATAAKALAELADSIPNMGGLVSFFSGDNDLSTFGYKLVPFGKSLKAYAESITGMDPKAIENSAIAVKSLSELAKNLPSTGGIFSFFTGDNDIGVFGSKLVPFGKGLKEYGDSITGMDPKAIKNSSIAVKSLSELAKNLPSTGGIFSFFTGDNDISVFGSKLVPFGEGLKAYADSITGMDPKAVENSAIAVKSLSELAKNLPDNGGMISWFTGDNSISDFGSKLAPFGKGLKAYGDSITGMDPKAIENSAIAARSLMELSNNLGDTGGLVSFFTGDSDISSFGSKLVPFGQGLKAYATSISDIDPKAIENSAIAAKSLMELSNNLGDSGGFISWFTGDNNISTFGSKLVPFGQGLKAYADSITGMDPKAVENSAIAAKSLMELSNNLNESGGFSSWFSGESDISSFGSKLVPFGQGLKAYADSITGMDPKAVENSAIAAKALLELSNNLPESGGLSSFFDGDNSISDFGSKLVPFGKGLKEYSATIAGINYESINSSVEVTKKLVSVIKSMNGLNTEGANSFKNAINALSKANVQGFVQKFNGHSSELSAIGKNITNAITKGMESKKDAVKTTTLSIVSTITKAIDDKKATFKTLGSTIIKEFCSGIKENDDKPEKAIKSALKTAVSAIKDYREKFYDAGAYVVTGFANGISENEFEAEAKAKAMAEAALTAAKAALREASPSKAFYEVGAYAGQGFVNALGYYRSIASKAGYKMADASRLGLSKAVSAIADVINLDLDSQPTIRPVLDLSDISDGVNSINGMLGIAPSIGVMSRVKSISSMMSSNQNGVNNDIISELKGLNKTLSKRSGDTYILDGITYDDGSNVSEAIKVLTRELKVERRK